MTETTNSLKTNDLRSLLCGMSLSRSLDLQSALYIFIEKIFFSECRSLHWWCCYLSSLLNSENAFCTLRRSHFFFELVGKYHSPLSLCYKRTQPFKLHVWCEFLPGGSSGCFPLKAAYSQFNELIIEHTSERMRNVTSGTEYLAVDITALGTRRPRSPRALFLGWEKSAATIA